MLISQEHMHCVYLIEVPNSRDVVLPALPDHLTSVRDHYSCVSKNAAMSIITLQDWRYDHHVVLLSHLQQRRNWMERCIKYMYLLTKLSCWTILSRLSKFSPGKLLTSAKEEWSICMLEDSKHVHHY